MNPRVLMCEYISVFMRCVFVCFYVCARTRVIYFRDYPFFVKLIVLKIKNSEHKPYMTLHVGSEINFNMPN